MPPPRFFPAFPYGLCWSVEVKHGDRVERTGADCTERLKKGKNSGRGHKLMLLWVQRKTLKQRRHHSLLLLHPIRFSCTILHDKKSEPVLLNSTPLYYASLTQVPRKLNEWQISGGGRGGREDVWLTTTCTHGLDTSAVTPFYLWHPLPPSPHPSLTRAWHIQQIHEKEYMRHV